jgi:pectin methylesterase-like acyl-CoA thioesterase/methionine-rich copper-binding protein CopC
MTTKSFFKLLAAMLCLPFTATAQQTLAEWNMEASDDIAVTWFNNGKPQIAPDECTGDKADYMLTAWSEGRYWQLCTGYQNKVLRIENTTANAIADYTAASSHNVYYEVEFTTKGYKNIALNFACAYGANAEATLEAVVSTDGGETWFDAGAYTTMPNWWLYKDNSVSLSANNKEKVLVRLIAGNGFASNWNLDYVKVSGEKMEDAQPVDQAGFTLSWPLGKGVDDATAAEVPTAGLFSVAEFDYGQLVISTQRAVGTCQQTLYKPSHDNGAVNDDDALTFTIKPKKGLTFAPKSFAFDASRWGTNGGKFDVVAIAGGTTTTLASAQTPGRANDGLFDSYSLDLTSLNVDENGLVLKIKIYNLAANKEYGFANVVVTGDVSGTPESVPTYTMSVKLGTEGAGSVSCNPAGAEFDEGTQLTVTATENFGYHFAAWTNAEGEVITTENPYTFEITGNTVLVATYTKKNVYALNLKLEGGANANLVQFLPAGNVVDGVHYYEEGTDVKLTAQNNRILTFTGWEDNTTAMERDVLMDGEKSLTASFSAIDYIVGWDLYEDAPKSERAADYKSDSENAGLLSLRKADGSTTTWLANGVAAGKVQGRYGIRVWRPLADNWYFEISFSSKGYENLKLSAAMGDDYNAYSIINAQYSTDGQNFTTFGTYELPNRGWKDGEFDLPADAAGQDRVWIRFLPDYTSPKVGVESANDGTMITDIFVLADATGAADEVATLVSSNPAQNSTGASASGSVILNFDNKVKAGQGEATLNGEKIAPVISGKTAVFKYSGLKYATEYTFDMPEGVLLSRSGKPVAAATITFTTMERQQPQMRLYDAVVDASATDGQDADAPYVTYTSLQEAIDAAPAGRAKPWLIFVKNGEYTEHIDIPKTKPYIHIIGQNRDLAVVKDNRLSGGPTAVHVSQGATVVVNADNCFFENITLENSYGHEKQDGPQALALNTIGDRIALNNVALLSYQDTWITTSTQKNRHYIKNSLIEGAVDFIYNGGDVYLDGDTLEINRPSGGYIVAPWHTAESKWGYVFQNNIIRAHKGVNVTDVWLGRPWHGEPKTVFINTQTFVNIPAKGWYNTMGGLPVLWAEYNTVDKDGNPVDLSQRETYYYYTDSNTGEKVETFGVKNTLTAEEAAEYTIKNVCGGDDNWQPDLMCEACDAPVVTLAGSKLSWNAVPYAICYVVTCNGRVVAFTTDTELTVGNADAGAAYSVQAVNEFGGLSLHGEANTATSVHLTTVGGEQAEAIFTLDGKRVNGMMKGVQIVRGSDGSVRKVVKLQ